MKLGDLVFLKSEEEFIKNGDFFEFDYYLLFKERDDALNFNAGSGLAFEIEPGIAGIVLESDENFMKIFLNEGIGWSRKGYWKTFN